MLWGLQGEGVVKELVDGFCALELEGDHLLQDAFVGGVVRRVVAGWRVDAQRAKSCEHRHKVTLSKTVTSELNTHVE